MVYYIFFPTLAITFGLPISDTYGTIKLHDFYCLDVDISNNCNLYQHLQFMIKQYVKNVLFLGKCNKIWEVIIKQAPV